VTSFVEYRGSEVVVKESLAEEQVRGDVTMDSVSKTEPTQLMSACQQNNIDLVREILQRGVCYTFLRPVTVNV